MGLHSLLYVSESTLSLPAEEWQVDVIIDVARRRNSALGVTGALMFTHVNFIQVLEGSRAALEELMESIGRDRRHRNIRVLEEETLAYRRFATWSMAYLGPAALVEPKVAPLVQQGGHHVDPFATEDMICLLRSLTAMGE